MARFAAALCLTAWTCCGPIEGQEALVDPQLLPSVVSSRTLSHQPPKNARKEFDQGMQSWRKSRIGDAQRHFSEAVRLDPSNVYALTALAVVHLRAHHPTEALDYLNRAVLLEPGWAVLHWHKASAFMMLDHPAEAEQEARWALELNPGWVDARYMLGLALLRQNRITPEAAQNLEAAAATYPRAAELLTTIRARLATPQSP